MITIKGGSWYEEDMIMVKKWDYEIKVVLSENIDQLSNWKVNYKASQVVKQSRSKDRSDLKNQEWTKEV